MQSVAMAKCIEDCERRQLVAYDLATKRQNEYSRSILKKGIPVEAISLAVIEDVIGVRLPNVSVGPSLAAVEHGKANVRKQKEWQIDVSRSEPPGDGTWPRELLAAISTHIPIETALVSTDYATFLSRAAR
jgi:hypothetical protein